MLSLALFLSSFSFAQNKVPARKSFDVSRMMHLTYGSASWNTDPTKIDSAYLILRDRTTGKIVQILLEETEPDSAQFTGQFHVNLSDTTISPEIYIPPKELRNGIKDYKKLMDAIQAGKLARKPVIMKKNEKGHSVLDVYDTREQAETALKAYEQEKQLALDLRKKQALKKINNEAAMVAAAEAERRAKLEKLALEAAQREQERLRLEQIERQKAAERAEALKRLTEEQKIKRRAQALELHNQALELYEQGDYESAEDKFKQAIDLDPENKSYEYKYGITLYRLNKFNQALVTLKISTVDPALETEKKYFMGLVHYRLGELENSLKQFGEVSQAKDPVLSPAATFYAGVVLFSQERYENAKKNFETVIDESQDPKLDAQAEDYLERVMSALAWKKLRENRFSLTGVVGAMYDSNVLLTPTSISGGGTPSDSADFRLNTTLDLLYRPVFTETNQWTPHATANLTNSVKNDSAPADPFIYTFAAPYSHTGKDWTITATPGYEMLFMDPSATGTKTDQMDSVYLAIDNTFVMSKKWTSLYTIEYRNDSSFDASSNGPDDLSSNKYTFRTVQTTFVDSAHKQLLLPSLAIVRNNAKGSNKTYNRFDAGVTYVRPINYGMTWNTSLALYQQTYSNTDPRRVDNNYTFITGVSKPWKEWIALGLSGTYIRNNSTDETYTYSKFMVMTTATITTSF